MAAEESEYTEETGKEYTEEMEKEYTEAELGCKSEKDIEVQEAEAFLRIEAVQTSARHPDNKVLSP